MQLVAENRCFDGRQLRYLHTSEMLGCDMHFSVYLPAQAELMSLPVVYWLSGLTCTDQNFVQKAGAQRYAAERGVILVVPDTSPRGEHVPDDPDNHWSFGHGASFYVDATQSPWSEHYRMHSYLRYELPELVEKHFPVSDRRAIMGHSMGGHGALVLALRHKEFYRSVSAFAPICQPSACPWGITAFSRLLGEEPSAWAQYDASLLLAAGPAELPIKVDQGSRDEFLEEQLRPEALVDAAQRGGTRVAYHLRDGYDHSYFFIASFIEQHIAFHAEHLA